MADIDPVIADYVETTRHGMQVDPTQAELQEVFLRVATERGSLLGQPLWGSELHTLATLNMGPGIEQVAKDMARDALQPMVDAGRLQELEVAAQKVDRHRLRLAVRAVAAGGRPVLFTHFVVV